MKKKKRSYVLKKPHRTVSQRDLKYVKIMLSVDLPKSLIAKAIGISREHLYRVMKQYNLE